MDLNTLYTQTKNWNLSKNNSGLITLSFTSLKDEFLQLPLGSKINFLNIELELVTTATPVNSPYTSYTFSNSNLLNNYDLLFPHTVNYRSVPESVWEMANYSAIIPPTTPPISDPNQEIKVKLANMYTNGGWTASDILDDVSRTMRQNYSLFDIIIPPIFDMDITELKITEGTPISAILSTLIPIPGLSINRFNNVLYVSIPKENFILPVNLCHINFESETNQRFMYRLYGLPSSPRYIEWSSENRTIEFNVTESEFFGLKGDEIFGEDKSVVRAKIHLNLVGGVFAQEEMIRQASKTTWLGIDQLSELIKGE